MQFWIDMETPDLVGGWLVPIRADSEPIILICRDRHQPIALRANVVRRDVTAAGKHSTGKIGFLISSETVPGLTSMDDLELRDAETGILIYRRERSGGDVKLKIASFRQGYGVQSALDRAIEHRVTFAYDNCAEYPILTLTSLLANPVAKSIWMSGAFSYKSHHALMRERGFLMIMLLKDPIQALAETLLSLRKKLRSDPGIVDNSTHYLEHFVAWFETGASDPLADLGSLQRAFSSLTEGQRQLLVDPAVRLLACGDEPPEHRHVALALEHLASLDAVGVESEFPEFRETLSELTGVNLLKDFVPSQSDDVRELSDQLSLIEGVEQILALDQALYQFAEDAITAAR